MTIRIDKEHNIVRILIRNSPIFESDEAENGVIYDFDENRRVVGMEFLNASDMLGDLSELEESLKDSGNKKNSKSTIAAHEYIAAFN